MRARSPFAHNLTGVGRPGSAEFRPFPPSFSLPAMVMPPGSIFLGPFFNQLRPSVAFEALGPSQFAARAAAIGWAQPAGGMAGDTQPGAVVVHELNAMGYTQLALESQAKASLVQGCACT